MVWFRPKKGPMTREELLGLSHRVVVPFTDDVCFWRSMTEKKAIELPGREGRWEEVSYIPPVVNNSTIIIQENWPGRDNIVVLRRVKEPPPMPELKPGDSVLLGHSRQNRFAVVMNVWGWGQVSICVPGEKVETYMSAAELFAWEVYRDGKKIWSAS